jgi:gluconokinase
MIIVLMGVTGVGKTTVGVPLAQACTMRFYDADDYHSKTNVDKMRAGIALQDPDRWPWLDRLNELLRAASTRGESAVLACSALKQSYRERLSAGVDDIHFVWLRGEKALIHERLAARTGHYMNPALLDSQLAALEPPGDAIVVDVDAAPEKLVAEIRRKVDL